MPTPDDMAQELLLELRKSAKDIVYDDVYRLIGAGANLSALNDQLPPPLHLAAYYGALPAVSFKKN